MPSGAKKRKAAKKKKEVQFNPSSDSTQTHDMVGDVDDLKHQDDKDSDVGEGSSPASQDPHSSFSGGDEEIGDNVSNPPPSGKEKIEVTGETGMIAIEESFIPVEREFKIDSESGKKEGEFEHDEIVSKSYYDGGSSSSSSSSNSSSDDESHKIKDSQTENIAAVDSVDVSSSGEKAEVDMSSTLESEFKENGEKNVSCVEDRVRTAEAVEDVAPQPEEATIISSVEKVSSISDKPQPEEAISISSVEKVLAISDKMECAAQESDDRLSLSYNAPIASSDNGADPEKDSSVSEPLLVPAPHPVQTTSWKGCCGLFEVFGGSGR